MSHPDHPTATHKLVVGDHVEVRRRFDQQWAKGFTVADCTHAGYLLRRDVDQALLPVPFPPTDLRLAINITQ